MAYLMVGFLAGDSVRRSPLVSMSFMLASLRVLHIDTRREPGGDGSGGGARGVGVVGRGLAHTISWVTGQTDCSAYPTCVGGPDVH